MHPSLAGTLINLPAHAGNFFFAGGHTIKKPLVAWALKKLRDSARFAGHARLAHFTAGLDEGGSEIWNAAYKKGASDTAPIAGTIHNLIAQEARHVQEDTVARLAEGRLTAAWWAKQASAYFLAGDAVAFAGLGARFTSASLKILKYRYEQARGGLFRLEEGASRERLAFSHLRDRSELDPGVESSEPVGSTVCAKALPDGSFSCPCRDRYEHCGIPCAHEVFIR